MITFIRLTANWLLLLDLQLITLLNLQLMITFIKLTANWLLLLNLQLIDNFY